MERFEKLADKIIWWILGFSFFYFLIRFLVGVIFDI